jgi:hypothetical protein
MRNVKRRTSFALFIVIGLAWLGVVAGCDNPGGGGSRTGGTSSDPRLPDSGNTIPTKHDALPGGNPDPGFNASKVEAN